MEAALETRCAAHTDRVSVWTCPRCGAFACSECASADPARAVCAACVAAGHADYEIPFETKRPDAPRGYWRTAWASLREASLFFGRFPLRGSLARAFAFLAATVGLAHVPIALCCFGISGMVVSKFMPALSQATDSSTGALVGLAFGFYFVLSMVLSLFLFASTAVLVHIGARAAGGKDAALGVTARAVAYMQAPLLLQVAGYASCFGLLYWVAYYAWIGVCSFFLLTRRYRTSPTAAGLVGALPGAVAIGLVTLLMVATFALPQLLKH